MKQLNKIVNLKEYDLVLSYSFGEMKRNCTGHIFECIEYFHILKNHFKCCILIGDCLDFEDIIGNILKKYTFDEQEMQDIIDCIHIADNPNIVIGNNLLLVDGNYKRLKDKTLNFNKKFAFPCGLQKLEDYPDDVIIFGDERVYDFYSDNMHHYQKKMLFSKMNLECAEPKFDYMMYITDGPRFLSNEKIEEICEKYSGSIVIYTDYNIVVKNENVAVKQVPVDDVFDFGTYIYTSIERKFDCSPRFIVECELRHKFVIFDLDYPIAEDRGLFYRYYDIIDDIESIELKSNDSIINKLLSFI